MAFHLVTFHLDTVQEPVNPGPSPLRTGRAALPHPALRLVVLPHED